MFVQARGAFELFDNRAGKLHRKCLGLSLREVDKNIRNIVRLGSEVDAGDNVSLVFRLGQTRGFCVGGISESV